MPNLNYSRSILLIFALVIVFTLVYSPHFNYPFPFHVDEWHHLEQAKKIINGEYAWGQGTLEAGFQYFLAGLFRCFDLVLAYKFLPAVWAVFSSLALFFTARRLTGNFQIALLSIFFFASIKSDVNVLGLWFFTPLTFAIPFIYLYLYCLAEGINRQNKKLILAGLAIMLALLPFHAPSVLFALPLLAIYCLINWRYLLKEWKFFSLFLLLPIFGIIFYKFNFNLPWPNLLRQLFEQLQFKKGWGVLELANPLTSTYSLIGYALAIIGALAIIWYKQTKQYLLFLLWPGLMLLWIVIYRLTDISFFSPHQRNLYYLTLGLPLLSAFGLYFLLSNAPILAKKILPNNFPAQKTHKISKIAIILIIGLAGFLTFKDYYAIPAQVDLYQVIDETDYQTLKWLKDTSAGDAVGLPFISTAMYAISDHQPIANLSFNQLWFGDIAEDFYLKYDCAQKQLAIDESNMHFKIRYVVSPIPIGCGWRLIYQQGNFIYQLNDQ